MNVSADAEALLRTPMMKSCGSSTVMNNNWSGW